MYGNEYYYEYNYDLEGAEGLIEFAAILVGFLMVFVLIAAIVGLVVYIFQSVGLYTIAKRRGIKHAWLSWIPIAYYWVTGCIADQYRYVARGQVKNRRTVMLVLAIVNTVLSGITGAVSGAGLSAMMETLLEGDVQAFRSAMLGGALGMNMLLSLLTSVISIVLLVFWFISLYDLYTSCNPQNNVLFLVLGIIFSFLNAFFIFANRNKDDGMPPRKQQPACRPIQEPAEPWENQSQQ